MEKAKRLFADPVMMAQEMVSKRAQQLFAGDARLFFTAPNDEELRAGLTSDSIFHQLSAMKRIIAQICKGNNMTHFFPDVVKTIHSTSAELRSLVYFFVVHYAAQCPNETLLSISAFQRDLLDGLPHVRAMALRMLGSIPIPAIQSVVMVALRKCAEDVAPIVRKAAAIAVYQVTHIGGRHADRTTLKAVLAKLLQDRHVEVVGAAAMAYNRLFAEVLGGPSSPHLLEEVEEAEAMVHPVFRSWCWKLLECDECGQVEMLRLLMRYCRTQFYHPDGPSEEAEGVGEGSSRDTNEEEEEEEEVSESSASSSMSSFSRRLRAHQKAVRYNNQVMRERGNNFSSAALPSQAVMDNSQPLDPDHARLLHAARPILRSLRPAPVLAVTALYYHCAPRSYLGECIGPLLRTLRFYPETRASVLSSLCRLVARSGRPEILSEDFPHFFLLPNDAESIAVLKLHLLSHILTPSNVVPILREFQLYLTAAWMTTSIKCHVLRSLAYVALSHEECASHVLRLFLRLLSSAERADAVLVEEVLLLLRLLVPTGDQQHRVPLRRAILQLMHHLLRHHNNLEAAEGRDANREEECNDKSSLEGTVSSKSRGRRSHRHRDPAPLRGSTTTRRSPRQGRGAMLLGLDPEQCPMAHASILWMAGEALGWHPGIAMAAPDLFRVSLRRFAVLHPAVKREVLYLGLKVWLHMSTNHKSPQTSTNHLDKQTGDAASDSNEGLAQRFLAMLRYGVQMASYDMDVLRREEGRLLAETLRVDAEDSSPAAASSSAALLQMWRSLFLAENRHTQPPQLLEPFQPPSPGEPECLVGGHAQLWQDTAPASPTSRGASRCSSGSLLPPWRSRSRPIDPSVRDPPVSSDGQPHWKDRSRSSSRDSSSSGGRARSRRARDAGPTHFYSSSEASAQGSTSYSSSSSGSSGRSRSWSSATRSSSLSSGSSSAVREPSRNVKNIPIQRLVG